MRFARRLEREGLLVQLSRGLYYRRSHTQGGPADEAIVRAVMGDHPFVLTGSERWNALGLGAVKGGLAMVYNTKRSGVLQLGAGRELLFRRVAFPRRPSPEWSVVDLLENAHRVQADKGDLLVALRRAVAQGRFERAALWRMASRYGKARTRREVRRLVAPPAGWIARRALEVFDWDRRALLRWMTTPQPALAGRWPRHLLKTVDGAREVADLLERLAAGGGRQG